MAHDLFDMRYFGRKPAWHNLGTVFTDNPDLVDSFTRGRLDYEFKLENTFSVVDGNYVEFPERKMIVRLPTDTDPNYVPIEVVSADYSLIQNMEIAQTFNALSKRWPVETVGALGKGETIFVTLDCGEIEIAGELVKKFFLITDNKTGLRQTNIAYVPFQVVCANTLKSGLAQASLNLSVKHNQGNLEKLGKISNIAEELQAKADSVNELFGSMTKVGISQEEFKELVEKVLYIEPEEPENVTEAFLKLKEKVRVEQETVVKLYEEYSDTRSGLAGNLFGAWSAIVDHEDFKPGRGNSKYKDALFGKRADKKAQAFTALAKKM
jgi:phage/plasmid-like protein (TIGR03299 family)